jgi:rhodanese-related sulfurtransferase
MQALVGSLVLAAVGAVLGLAINGIRADGVPLFHPFVADGLGTAECVASAAPARIDVGEAERLQDARGAVFGDVRSADEYATGHVVDAIHLPCSADAPVWLANVAKSSTVIVYGGSDADADQVAQSLAANGYADVRVLSGGFGAWRDHGGSAASGPCEVCN